MWKCKEIKGAIQVVDFLNENNIKPENCKMTECDDYYSVFYYVVDSEV
jgi:hypothetical protein